MERSPSLTAAEKIFGLSIFDTCFLSWMLLPLGLKPRRSICEPFKKKDRHAISNSQQKKI